MNECLNCGKSVSGNYCQHCGQRTNVQPLSMKTVFQEIPHALFNFERRYWNTIRDFFRNPMGMVRAYSKGKRRFYAPPIQFFFFFATISLLFAYLVGDGPDSGLNTTLGTTENSPAFLNRMKSAGDYLRLISISYSNYFELGIPLFLGFATKLFFYRRIKLAEAMVFSFISLALSLEPISTLAIPFGRGPIIDNIMGGSILLLMGYFYSSVGKRWWLSIILGYLSMFFAILMYILTLWLLLALIVPWLPEI